MVMAIIGINGKMGSRVYEYYRNRFTIIGVDKNCKYDIPCFNKLALYNDKIDVVIDFSDSSAVDNLEYALKNNILVISGTTSYTDEQIANLKAINNECFIHSVNFAKGIGLFTNIIKECNNSYSLIDFIEIHQKDKKDAPSGTARMLAKEINFNPREIQSLRLNNSHAIHELIFASGNERIIVTHEVIGPNVFIDGLDQTLKNCFKDL